MCELDYKVNHALSSDTNNNQGKYQKQDSVAQPRLRAARWVMRVEAHVERLRSMELSFITGTLSTMNELRNVTHTTRAR